MKSNNLVEEVISSKLKIFEENSNSRKVIFDWLNKLSTNDRRDYIIPDDISYHDIDLNNTDVNGNSPIFLACEKGNLDIVKLLISLQIDINKSNSKSNDKRTPIWRAFNYGHLDIVKMLILEASFDVNQANHNITELLNNSIDRDYIEIANLLILKGANIHEANYNGETPIFIACLKGQIEIVNFLILKGVDLNQADNLGVTPINKACFEGYFEIVKLLISAGADINKSFKYKKGPIYWSLYKEHFDIAKLLILKGANIHQATVEGVTPLSLSCQKLNVFHKSNHYYNGCLDIVKILLYYNVDMSNIVLSSYITKFNLPNDEFSTSSSNDEIRSYLIKEINWNNRNNFINFLDKTLFVYDEYRNEENKESYKKNRIALSLNAHNCINSNHRLIACFLG